MPRRKVLALRVEERAPWISELHDLCLQRIVVEALVARDIAWLDLQKFLATGGAKNRANKCRKQIEVAETIISKIRDEFFSRIFILESSN